MNVEIGIEGAQFPEKEYINVIFVAVWHCPFKEQIRKAKTWKEIRKAKTWKEIRKA